MDAKQKAIQLSELFESHAADEMAGCEYHGVECAKICVKEIINVLIDQLIDLQDTIGVMSPMKSNRLGYWNQVYSELNKM